MFTTMGLVVALAAAAAAPLPAHLEEEARRIEKEVVAPCCWSQQVAVHQSPAADEMRKDIRIRLERGETHQGILEDYVVQFGSRILVEPPASGYRLLLYVFPPVAFIASAAGVLVFLKRASSTRAASTAGDVAAPAGTYSEQLNEELRDLD